VSESTLSVVIPNWNGARLLGDCLTSVVTALSAAGCPSPVEIIVADDGSTDGSLALLRDQFPFVTVVTAPVRSGFIANANRGIARCTRPYVLLLNNDVTLHEGFFADWPQAFADSTVFSVTPRMLRPDGHTFDSGRRVGVWDHGLLRHWVVADDRAAGPTLYASGGASFYRTMQLRVLGGFDPLYRPMYMEDLDVSYRGWKRGWATMYQPQRVAYHHGSVSSKQVYRERQLSAIIAKNHYLFTWKNITDPTLTRQHLMGLPYWLAQAWRPGRRVVTAGWFLALRQFGEARQRRAVERQQQRVSDRELWARFQPTLDDLARSPYLGWAGTA
jgi:GT2 family glycosyltransferase